jgi:hypothetical protein
LRADKAANDRSYDPQDNRGDDSSWLFARHQHFRQESGDEAENDPRDNSHNSLLSIGPRDQRCVSNVSYNLSPLGPTLIVRSPLWKEANRKRTISDSLHGRGTAPLSPLGEDGEDVARRMLLRSTQVRQNECLLASAICRRPREVSMPF